MRHLGYLLIALICATLLLVDGALAQGTANPTGTFTPGHALRATTPSGSPYADGGGAGGSAVFGKGYLSEVGITNTGMPWCINDALTSGPYHRLCWGHQGNNARVMVDPVNGATAGELICDINGIRIPCFGGVVSGLPFVSSTAALTALASTYNQIVLRLDTVPGNGSPPVLYQSTSSACTLGSGAGDGGLQIATSDGFCWVAILDGAGVDPRIWGPTGTTDDTPLFQTIDTAMGSSAWPANTAKTIRFPAGTVNVHNWLAVNVQKLAGADRDTSIINMSSAGVLGQRLVAYYGPGPFTAENLTFQCPIYNPVTLAQPIGSDGLRIGNTTSGIQQSTNIYIHRIKTTGCENGLRIFGAEHVVVDDVYNDRSWNFGWVVSQQFDTLSAHTRYISVRNTYGVNSGQYCGSSPVNTQNIANIVSEKLEYLDIGCDGAGFKDTKLCFDIPTTTASHEIVVRGWGRNCKSGGIESKVTQINLHDVPTGTRNVKVDFTYYSNIDQGNAIQIPFENTTNAVGGEYSDVFASIKATYNKPVPRLANAYYAAGMVWQANGNVYKVATPGTTAAGGGPSGTTNGITDGTAQVDYVEAVPAGNAEVIKCAQIEGIVRLNVDMRCFSTYYGLYLNPRTPTYLGGADVHIEAVNLSGPCAADSTNASGDTASLRITGTCSSVGDTPLFEFGLNATTPVQYNNIEINGGSWRQSSTSAAVACIRNYTAASFNLKITGGASFDCSTRVFYLTAPANIYVIGGGLWNLTGAAAQSAIVASGADATGTFEVNNPVRIITTADPTTGQYFTFVNSSGAALDVYGRFVRGWTSNAAGSLPTDHCTSGDTMMSKTPGVSSQPDQGFYCSVAQGATWGVIGTTGSVPGGIPVTQISSPGAYQLPAGGGGQEYSNISCGLVTFDMTQMDVAAQYWVSNVGCAGSTSMLDPGAAPGTIQGLTAGQAMPLGTYQRAFLTHATTNTYTVGFGSASSSILASYVYANLPAVIPVGSRSYCTDCRKAGEGAGAGTGVSVVYDATLVWFSEYSGLAATN